VTVNLNPTPEQHAIVQAMRSALGKEFPVARLRDAQGTSSDPARLPMLTELGTWGLAAPERVGGLGLGLVEAMLVCVELGRHVVTPNALASLLGARVAAALGEDALAQAIVRGERSVCVANALVDCDVTRTQGVHGAHGLHGIEAHLVDSEEAALALLWNDSGIALLQRGALQGITIAATDRSISLRRCALHKDAVIGSLAAQDSPLAREAHLLLCAHLLGIAEATRDLAVTYARTREQFGRPIGSFQAVKHRCADMAIAARALKAQLGMATLATHGGWPDALFQADACRLLAARSALANAAACIQIHGGMGFTAECDAHLYLLRAHLCEHLGGPRAGLLERLAAPGAFDMERSDA
jgi:alkylation response protein AidB-like acyl-CoA dehydrogenase